MTVNASVVEVVLESRLENLELAADITRQVCGTAGFDEDDQFKVEMAVHETLINAVAHGNKQDATKHVWMRFHIFGDRLEIRIRDEGTGFDLSSLPDPLAEQNLLKVSGRGIFLIRTFMDEFRVENIAGTGTEVVMVKRLNSRPQADQGGRDREHEGHSAAG